MRNSQRKAATPVSSPAKKEKIDAAAELAKATTTNKSALRVFAVTWNMGNVEALGLSSIFEEKNALQDYDLLVVGLQESTYAMNNGKPSASADCIAHLAAQLNSCVGKGFYQVEHCYRAQLQLFLFAKTSLRPRISSVEKSIENTGFLHVFPNKGGLLVSLSVDGTRLAFVSCHLTAHEGVHHCEQRNVSIVEILGGVRAGDQRFDITEQFHHVFWMGDMNYRLTFSADMPANTKKNILEMNAKLKNAVTVQHVNVKMDGQEDDKMPYDDDDDSQSENENDNNNDNNNVNVKDNVNVNDAPTDSKSKKAEHRRNRQKVLDMVREKNWKDLLALDELNREIAAGRVLNQFTALQPAFPPTFKRARKAVLPAAFTETDTAENAAERERERQECVLDTFYNEKRIPSFTDRILFKSLPAFQGDITPLFFDSCEHALSSDHKPVRAGLQVALSRGVEDIFVDREAYNGSGSASLAGETHLRLVVHGLRASNLEEMDAAMFGGGSDPYVVITTDPPSLLMEKQKSHAQRVVPFHEGVRSKVIKHELNPVWKDRLAVHLASLDVEGLARNASLIFSVWDEDTLNADDLIGAMSIPLREVLQTLFVDQRDFKFDSAVLRSNAEIMGTLSGTISLEGDVAEYLSAMRGVVEHRAALAENNNNNNNSNNNSSNAVPAAQARYVSLARAVVEAQQSDHCCSLCTVA